LSSNRNWNVGDKQWYLKAVPIACLSQIQKARRASYFKKADRKNIRDKMMRVDLWWPYLKSVQSANTTDELFLAFSITYLHRPLPFKAFKIIWSNKRGSYDSYLAANCLAKIQYFVKSCQCFLMFLQWIDRKTLIL